MTVNLVELHLCWAVLPAVRPATFPNNKNITSTVTVYTDSLLPSYVQCQWEFHFVSPTLCLDMVTFEIQPILSGHDTDTLLSVRVQLSNYLSPSPQWPCSLLSFLWWYDFPTWVWWGWVITSPSSQLKNFCLSHISVWIYAVGNFIKPHNESYCACKKTPSFSVLQVKGAKQMVIFFAILRHQNTPPPSF